MILFDYNDVLLSMLYALIFGFSFAFVYSIILLIKRALVSLPSIVKDVFFLQKSITAKSFDYLLNNVIPGRLLLAFSIVIYGIGFFLLSYVVLDGQIRIYMLIISFAAFYLSKFAFYDLIFKILIRLCIVFLKGLTIVIRWIFHPIKKCLFAFRVQINKLI